MYNIQVIRQGGFRNQPDLLSEMVALAAPFYDDANALLNRAVNHNDTTYLARDHNQQLISFCMFAWETLTVEGKVYPSVYVGLCVNSTIPQYIGIINVLYANFLQDALAWECEHRKSLILWGQTASPVIYLGATRIFANLEPRLNGSYSPENHAIATAIQQRYGQYDAGHPFVLKNIALNTRYSQAHLAYLYKRARHRQFELFESLHINEAEGDRLIFIARVPPRIVSRG